MLLLQLPKRKWAGVQLQLLLKVSSKTNIQSRPVQALYWTWPGLLPSQWPGIFVHSCNNCLLLKQLLQEWTNIPGHWLQSRPGQVQYRACTGLDWIFVLLDTFKRSCSWTPAHFLFGSWRSNISREELLLGKQIEAPTVGRVLPAFSNFQFLPLTRKPSVQSSWNRKLTNFDFWIFFDENFFFEIFFLVFF